MLNCFFGLTAYLAQNTSLFPLSYNRLRWLLSIVICQSLTPYVLYKVDVKIEVKCGLHRADFHVTRVSSANICKEILYRISWNSTNGFVADTRSQTDSVISV